MADEPTVPNPAPVPQPECRRGALPWFALSLAAGAGLFALIFFGINVVNPPAPAPAFGAPWVSVELPDEGGLGGGVLGEQAALFDTEPLFLPTRWNAGRARSFTEIGAGRVKTPFAPYDLTIAPDAAVLKSLAQAPVAAPLRPESMLAARYADFLSQFGRTGEPVPPAARVAFLRVMCDGKTVREIALEGNGPAVLTEKLWPPVDFMILVGASGTLLGEPLALGSAGDEEIDKTLRNVVRAHLESERLEPGHFRVSVMP